MSSKNGTCLRDGDCDKTENKSFSLHKFKLYETRSKFYIIGRDKSRTHWRVLKIDRLDPSELIIREDPTTYTQNECHDLLQRIDEGNRPTGGLRFVTNFYGIVGFIKFLEPHYMILITKRRQIGNICGHVIYGITKSRIILVPHPSVRSNLAYSKDEQRYKKLLSTVDLTKDFIFSYTYHIMWSLQRNLSIAMTGQIPYETMFVWNEFLTRGIRHYLNNTLWTVALIYGFFKQAKLSISGKYFSLTLIARRSRHYAGTRYLKRGVNEKGRVANDVETEQIVFEDVFEGCPQQISSVVQHRGSIPLYWSQETSRLNIKPDIILQKKDPTYQATRLHFENLVKRYGNPIIVLNLIRKYEKQPRESILCAEFANAINFINRNLSEESRLKFIDWDFHKFSRSKSTNVLALLVEVANEALDLTGFYYGQIESNVKLDKKQAKNSSEKGDMAKVCPQADCDDYHMLIDNELGSMCIRKSNPCNSDEVSGTTNEKQLEKKPIFQRGVLRTNCIDCLDRTNVAQYAYGLVALGRQLHALGLMDVPKIDLDTSLAGALMGLYENMGDTLALQYGGSAAHNKVFCERRGQWKAATHSQELFRALQRYYNNAYMDAEKQNAINVFLGHFQPQQGKPALWELDSDQHCSIGRHVDSFVNEETRNRSSFKRSLSDGNILMQNVAAISTTPAARQEQLRLKVPLTEKSLDEAASSYVCDSTTEKLTCGNGTRYSRYIPSRACKQLFTDYGRNQSILSSDQFTQSDQQEITDGLIDSNFNDMDWLSSSGNSCEEDSSERCLGSGGLEAQSSHGSDIVDITMEISEWTIGNNQISEGMNQLEKTDEHSQAADQSKQASDIKSASKQNPQAEGSLGETMARETLTEFSNSFVHWVCHGQMLCH